MTHHEAPPMRVGNVIRWWPLILLPAIIAVAAAYWSVHSQSPSYTAVTRLMITPLAQWDETFLGTSLIRDSGDAKTTASTTAALLDSPRSVAIAAADIGDGCRRPAVDKVVKVAAVPDTNVVEVSAISPDPKVAEKLSEEYSRAVLADRWRTISTELDARIAAVSATTAMDPNAGEASARLQTLTLMRQSGADPTLKIESSAPAVEDPQLPAAVVLGLAGLGGVVVGLLCALVALRLRRPRANGIEPRDPAPERDSGNVRTFTSDGAG